MLSRGDVLNGRYVIQERIGSGGYGTVFRARDRKENRLVAVKVLRADLADDPDYRRRFRREADIARSLKSEHVVRVLESGEAEVRGETIDFQVMEFMDGETLQERIKRGRIPVRKALYVAAQIAEALDEAEERGIVHRDVKPKNIFIGKSELARLGDFGVARAIEYPSLQPDDPILGTPRYMSPEQCLGTAEETDIRSDIYSLGIVLYEMIAGSPPFGGDSPNVIAFKHVNEHPKPLKTLGKRVPDDVEQLVMRCLEKRPEGRYQHASELRSALWSVIDGVTSGDDTPITPFGARPGKLPFRLHVRRALRIPQLRRILARRRSLFLSLVVPTLLAGITVGVTVAIINTGAISTGSPTPTEDVRTAVEPTKAANDGRTTPAAPINCRSDPEISTGYVATKCEAYTNASPAVLGAAETPRSTPTFTPRNLSTATSPSTQQPTSPPTPTPFAGLPVDVLVFAGLGAGDPNQEIYWISASGGTPIRLTDSLFPNRNPKLSPDHDKIAFVREGLNASDDIYVINADGSGETNLTNSPDQEDSPSWSPQGDRLAFIRNGQLYTMAADGSDVKMIPTPSPPSSVVWSPYPSILTFTVRNGSSYDLYSESLDGTGWTKLDTELSPLFDFCNGWVVTVDSDGILNETSIPPTASQTLTIGGGNSQPSCSRDGSMVAYLHKGNDPFHPDLYVLDRTGPNGPTKIIDGVASGIWVAQPDW